MAHIRELQREDLYKTCRPDDFQFQTTADLKSSDVILGQSRAADALRFGLGIENDGYNIFALGPPGVGKQFLVEHYLRERVSKRPVPPDLCYVNNFSEPNNPLLLVVPAGLGINLKSDLKEFVEEVSTALPAVFDSEEYQAKLNAIRQSAKTDAGLAELQRRARENGIAMLHSPAGAVFAPMKDGEVLSREEFDKLPPQDQQRLATAIEEFEQQLASILRQAPRYERERIPQETPRLIVLPTSLLLTERACRLKSSVLFVP